MQTVADPTQTRKPAQAFHAILHDVPGSLPKVDDDVLFALIDAGFMSKTEKDTIEDFRNVFDFKTAFDADYRIESKSP